MAGSAGYLDWRAITGDRDAGAAVADLLRGAVGRQVSVNHPQCPAGHDRKRRLYLKLAGPGVVLGYCHHCNQSGIHGKRRNQAPSVTRSLEADATYGHLVVSELPYRRYAGTPMSAWEPAPRQWAMAGGITQKLATLYGIYPVPTRGLTPVRDYSFADGVGLVLPTYHHRYGEALQTAAPTGYQIRMFGQAATHVKYLSGRLRDHRDDDIHILAPRAVGAPPAVVIVEDILSSIAVSALLWACALRTVTLRDGAVATLLASLPPNPTIFIWLDNDNPAVREARLRLVRELSPHATVRVVTTNVDPKHLPTTAIARQLLNAAQ